MADLPGPVIMPQVWDRLVARGLVDVSDLRVRLTDQGLLLADGVLAELAPDHSITMNKDQLTMNSEP